MHSRFTISITDITGSRHWELHKGIKKALVLFVIVAIVSIPAVVLAIHHLNQSVYRLENKNSKMINVITAKYSLVGKEYKNVSPDNNSEISEIRDIFSKLEIIEAALKTKTPLGLSLAERMERAGRFIAHREKKYRQIVKQIENIEQIMGLKSSDNLSPLQRVNSAGHSVFHKAVMLGSIPNGCPVQFKGISSRYGRRIHPTLKVKEYHKGVDLYAALNTPVQAVADGVVEFAGLHRKSGFGILIILRHNYAFKTLYGHLNRLNVKAGDVVKKGQKIAVTGNTGITDGPHLHYEIRYIERSLDPEPFMKWNMENYDLVFQKVENVKWESLKSLIDHRLTPPTRPLLHLAQK